MIDSAGQCHTVMHIGLQGGAEHAACHRRFSQILVKGPGGSARLEGVPESDSEGVPSCSTSASSAARSAVPKKARQEAEGQSPTGGRARRAEWIWLAQ